ncbi:MAG: amino acid racemase [Alphaproteobacteria bacterium]|nr:amino acid racemase [Alphaproteobacteria bacterium]
MSKQSKTVGVLGGMGPAATLDFFARVLALTDAKTDQDHLRLIIDNNPQVPNRNDAIVGTGPSPAPTLVAMAQGLERAGAELLVMPCNAAHAFLADVKRATRLPVVSIIDVTVEATRANHRVGLLAADGCINAGLYQNAFGKLGVETIVPSAQTRERFMATLYRIKQGDTGHEVRTAMRSVATDLISQGAEIIVAGCTEVPLVLDANDIDAPFVNSTDCLAKAAIAAARS